MKREYITYNLETLTLINNIYPTCSYYELDETTDNLLLWDNNEEFITLLPIVHNSKNTASFFYDMNEGCYMCLDNKLN